MAQPFDASKSLATLEQDNTVIAVIEMSQSKWLVAAVVPGVKRQPLKKLQADEEALLKLLYRWRTEAGQTGREIKRVVSPTRPDATGSGWRAGCGRAVSRPTLAGGAVAKHARPTGRSALCRPAPACRPSRYRPPITRASKYTMACGPSLGVCSRRSRRASSICRI